MRHVLLTLGLFACLTAGCGRQDVITEKAPSTTTTVAEPAFLPKSVTEAGTPLDRLQQPFDVAVAPLTPLATLPPTTLVSGKSVGKIHEEVKRLWPTIRFRTDDGRPIVHVVTLETDQGNIVMEMLPEAAPNHVRNFVALAMAGYYDGLRFETRIGEKSAGSAKAIAGGSPRGDGDDVVNVGYWLQHEILNDEYAAKLNVRHVPGTVGAVHVDQHLNTSCCRFYICVTEAKELDGEFTIFARVTQGLDIAERIFHTPVDEAAESPKPFTQPIVIRKASVGIK